MRRASNIDYYIILISNNLKLSQASKRFKAELLMQMDGLTANDGSGINDHSVLPFIISRVVIDQLVGMKYGM